MQRDSIESEVMEAQVTEEPTPPAATVTTSSSSKATSTTTATPSAGSSLGSRPPNRPAHERFLEDTATELATLETRRKFLQDRLAPLKEDLAASKKEREDTNEERNKVETQLASINNEVTTLKVFKTLPNLSRPASYIYLAFILTH